MRVLRIIYYCGKQEKTRQLQIERYDDVTTDATCMFHSLVSCLQCVAVLWSFPEEKTIKKKQTHGLSEHVYVLSLRNVIGLFVFNFISYNKSLNSIYKFVYPCLWTTPPLGNIKELYSRIAIGSIFSNPPLANILQKAYLM